MKRLDLIRKRDESWNKVEFLKDIQEKIKDKDKSINYSYYIKREKFKYKIYNGLLKAKNRCD